jgi:endo-1,4-beta-xylanase
MQGWSRRRAIGLGLAAASCAPVATPAPGNGAGDSLQALAAAKGMRFGAAMGASGATNEFADDAYKRIVLRDCGLVVSENEHKMHVLQPSPGVFAFERADAMMAWAAQNHLAYRGHNLIWQHPRWLPRWVMEHDYGPNPRAEAERIITTHISTVCAHFGERLCSWDVVNETIDEHSGEMRVTPLSRALGPEVIDVCFHSARAALPNTELAYNDYMGWESGSANHRAGVLRALEAWLGRGVPIDALGVQSHLKVNDHSDERAFRAFLDEVAGMGLKLHITEFDVNDQTFAGDIPERDLAVAADARGYLDLMLSYPQLGDVLCWGMVDKDSWLQNFRPREDGDEKRPLPYDSNYLAKPMRAAIAEAFRSAPAR